MITWGATCCNNNSSSISIVFSIVLKNKNKLIRNDLYLVTSLLYELKCDPCVKNQCLPFFRHIFFYPSWMKKVDFAKSRPAADGAIVWVKKNQIGIFNIITSVYSRLYFISTLWEPLEWTGNKSYLEFFKAYFF